LIKGFLEKGKGKQRQVSLEEDEDEEEEVEGIVELFILLLKH